MALVVCVLVAALFRGRRSQLHGAVDVQVLGRSPVAECMRVACQSPDLLACMSGMSALDEGQRARRVEALGFRYSLGVKGREGLAAVHGARDLSETLVLTRSPYEVGPQGRAKKGEKGHLQKR
jgi:hypothetical protein